MNYLKFKRVIDLLFSIVGIIILLPFYVAIIIAIRIDSKGPALFTQKRVGKGKTYFNMLKFRTMSIDAPKNEPTHILKNPDQYITRVGRFLRKASLDELPQIWNILIGQMSFVGPRPALWNQYDLVTERDKDGVNDLIPGLTGWAQINGRDKLPITVKARLDGEYVRKMNLCFDLKCLLGTVLYVLRKDGVVEGGTGSLQDNDAYAGESKSRGIL